MKDADNRPLLVPLLAISSALLLVGCDDAQGRTTGAPAALPEVRVVRVIAEDAPDVLTTSGRIEAVHDVDLRPRVGGAIVRVAYREGARVEAGTPLFELDPRPFLARRDQALAERARATAALTLARDELARARALHDGQALSPQDVERRAAEVAVRAAEQAGAEAALAAAALELEFATVRAPIDGLVGRALVSEGDHVAAGETLLTTLVSVDPIHVRFVVDEATHQRLRDLGDASLHVRAAVADGRFVVEGAVDALDNRIDPTTGSAFVRALLPNADGRLTAGLYARVDLFVPVREARVLVPETALSVAQGRRVVYVVGDDATLEVRPVTLGPRVGKQRVVADGLRTGERVASGNLSFLRPGALVNPVEHPSPAAPAAASEELP